MLTIRDAQTEALRRHAIVDFQKQLRGRVAELAPNFTAEQVEAQVARGMALAAEFHLSREIDVARFVEIVLVHLGGFKEQPLPKPALSILYGYKVDPEVKLRRFREWCEETARR